MSNAMDHMDFLPSIALLHFPIEWFGYFFLRFYLFIFRQRGSGIERQEEKHQLCGCTRAPSNGDLAHIPGMCPDGESNQRPFGSQASTQSTEPHQPELE